MVGQPPDRLCLTMTAAFLTSTSARQAISSFLQQSSDGSSVELALGCAARQGFPKMLIHRWYRMLRPSAWLSWDTKLRQISRALFFQKAPQRKRKLTLILRVCYFEIHHLHTNFYPHSCCSPKSTLNSTSWQAIMLLENKVLLIVRACEDSCQTSYRCLLAFANQAKRKQPTKLFADHCGLSEFMVWCQSQLFSTFVCWTFVSWLGVQTLLLYFSAFFSLNNIALLLQLS